MSKAKVNHNTGKHDSGRTISTKSAYGSHAEMVVKDHDIVLLPGEVVCRDDEGCYITTKDRLDSGLADPNRYNPDKRMVADKK